MTNSQAASHESWLVRYSLMLRVLTVSNLPQFPSFCKNQLTPLARNLVTLFPSFLHANFLAIRENIFSSSWESSQGFRGGSSTSQPPYYILMICCNLYRYFDATPYSRTDLGHTPFSSRCTRHFSLPHYAPIFSRIHPLGG